MGPRIIKNHDYISVDFGNGRRLTAGRSGEKATGAVPSLVFDRWHKMVHNDDGMQLGDRIQKFVDEINSLWPEWSTPPKAFKVGDKVKVDFGKKKGGLKEGVIIGVKRTNYSVRFDAGLYEVPGDMLREV